MDDLRKLTVLLWEDSPTWTDCTQKAFDFSRDPFALPLESDGFLYLGRRKPFNQIYIEIEPNYANSVATSLTAEYWDGAQWVNLSLPVEDTEAFSRSGFIKWLTPSDSSLDGIDALLWKSSEVNSISNYWIRLSCGSTLTAATKVRGLNIIFADDHDLIREDYGIMRLLPTDENENHASSHILTHVAVREDIIRKLRRKGEVRVPGGLASTFPAVEDIDEWDLLRPEQVNLAAVYAALSRIYFAAANEDKGSFWAKHKEYNAKFEEAMATYLLSVDINDDGAETKAERGRDTSTVFLQRR